MRAVIVGVGHMGTHHLRVARSLGLETFTVDPLRPADFVSLDQAPPAEIIAVATPIADLAATARTAMQVGCQRLLVEKPLAATVAEAELLAQLSLQTGTRMLVGYSERFDPLIQQLKRQVGTLIGTVRQMAFERLGPLPRWNTPGPAVDLAVHDIDLLHFLGFSPTLVEAWCSPRAVKASLDCSGAVASLDARYVPAGRHRRLLLQSPGAALECDLLNRTMTRIEADRRDSVPIEPVERAEPLLREWEALLAGGGPGVTEALAALRLAEQLTHAAPANVLIAR